MSNPEAPASRLSELTAQKPRQAQGPPFFVVGVQRSGTTMLRLMLDSHPEIAVPFETGFITVFYRKLAEYGDLGKIDNVRRLLQDICGYHKVKQGNLVGDIDRILAFPIDSYGSLVDTIMTQYAIERQKHRWGDKTPFYISDIDVLWQVFPKCRIIHLVRDGRDVAESLRRVSWGSSNVLRIAEDWRWKVTLAHKIGNVLGPYYLEIRYEELVMQTEATLGRICDFLEVRFHETMLAYHHDGVTRMPAKSMAWHDASVKPPDSNKVAGWKRSMSVTDRILFENVAGQTLEMFGYERERQPKTLRSRFKTLYFSTLNRW